MKSELVQKLAFALFSTVVASTPDEVRIPTKEQSQSVPNHEISTEIGSLSDDVIYKSEQEQLVQSIQLNSTSQNAPTAEDWHGRWSYEPVCTEFLEVLESELCVYTNATFSHGRGISIFTTPKIAEEAAGLLPFHDAGVLEKRGINSPEGPWYTKELPGKGIGMLAKQDLKRGDLVTAFTPYLLAHAENVLTTMEREKFLQIGLKQLPTASQEHYLSLAKYYNDPSVVVQDVVKANAFEMQVGGLMHLAVFPESSRLNHACAPNAQYYLESDMLTHVVRAARPIARDEEITIAYSPPFRPHNVRQEYLQDAFRFTCTCSRCQKGEATDQSLLEIHNLQQSLGNWAADSQASVKQAERLVKVYLEEELDGFLDFAYGHAALTYNSMGSQRGTIKYAQLAAEAAALNHGPQSSNVKTWMNLMSDPMAHSSWRRRKDNPVVVVE
ncbi:uncharacterized protein A1O9_09804 [Exophiala aquamarina CBS 119918]|uniref:SET domain-containing protein n=1 Tax=Exophiala aquamarina CBS 119918 TaxID=1182545 RepID=A0A072P1L5_9EURO|nr:uncharacterized protein A1O9_09804 [Exophiala aquamarina CBS 119918]KEF54009.1 hypothetical protein A1O9_09804 [Exophiala aquamarina CBS 119918]